MLSVSDSVCIQERGKNASHIEAWANTSATVSRRNHEPQYANEKQVFCSRISDRESKSARIQSHFKEMLLCSSMASSMASDDIQRLFGLHVDFVL